MGRKKSKGGGGGGGGGHDGGGGLRWLLTYADLITLLVAFFVIMYAMSQTDAKKFKAVAGAMKEAFNTQGGGRSLINENPGTVLIERPDANGDSKKLDQLTMEKLAQEKLQEQNVQKKDEAEFSKVQEQVNKYAQEQGIGNLIITSIDERGLIISVQDTVFFDTGKAQLQPRARDVLDKVAKIIYPLPNPIRIEGHTDNVPIKTAEYPDNWRLSTDRAVAVLMYFQNTHGFKPIKLSAAGYGEYRPKADNSTESGRAINRRVDIVILRTTVDQSKNNIVNNNQ